MHSCEDCDSHAPFCSCGEQLASEPRVASHGVTLQDLRRFSRSRVAQRGMRISVFGT